MAGDCICITTAAVYDRSCGQQEIQIIVNTVSMHLNRMFYVWKKIKTFEKIVVILFYCVTSTLRLNVNKQFLRLFRFLSLLCSNCLIV